MKKLWYQSDRVHVALLRCIRYDRRYFYVIKVWKEVKLVFKKVGRFGNKFKINEKINIVLTLNYSVVIS